MKARTQRILHLSLQHRASPWVWLFHMPCQASSPWVHLWNEGPLHVLHPRISSRHQSHTWQFNGLNQQGVIQQFMVWEIFGKVSCRLQNLWCALGTSDSTFRGYLRSMSSTKLLQWKRNHTDSAADRESATSVGARAESGSPGQSEARKT